jgi:2-oxoisovalerate dehydrogenase E1 component
MATDSTHIDAVGEALAREALEDLRLAHLSRALDDRELALQKQSRVFFQISGAGHEALLLATARALRPGHDWFFPYYRDRALVLGLGVTPYALLLQAVGSAEDPSSAGRQMPCHWGDTAKHIVSQTSATGSQCLPAVGCAEAGAYLRDRTLPGTSAQPDEITYVSLGDGATNEGEFWESLNTACRLALPMLFLVEDNGYAISVRASDSAAAPVSTLARGYPGLEIAEVDGGDWFAVRDVTTRLVDGIRAGGGPALVHAHVTRPYSHSAADTQSKYRPAAELEAEAANDPIRRLEADVIARGWADQAEVDALRSRAVAEVAQAAKDALAARRPNPDTILEHVIVQPRPIAVPEPSGVGEVVAYGEAIRRALHEAMAADERVRVFGEDVADAPDDVLPHVEGKGGVFGTTLGLQRTFGSDRCFNTPIAEANIVGRAIGQGIRGLRPSPEIQFFDYIWTAMQQIKTEAATLRWRSNGEFSCPMVLRVPIGGYLTGGSIWHSQSGESIFAHIPGLIVMFPSRARDAVGLLRTAFRCEDPVLFLEHKHLLRQPYTRDPYPAAGWEVPLGCGTVDRRGRDLTIVTYGATVEKSRQAADLLAGESSASIEILDLRCIVPWDQELVAESVSRTGRALVVHEDIRTAGFGAEVAAWIGEHCFEHLDAPVTRVGAKDSHVPYEPTLEREVLPQVDDIADAARRLLGF